MAIELAPHQLKVLGEIKNGTIVKGGVGTGKSRTALAYYFFNVCGGKAPINGVGEHGHMERPRDLFVFTTKKKKDELDWISEASDFGIFRDRENSVGNVSITVDTWNNITKYDESLRGAFVIFDEQRLVGAGAWVKAFYKLAAANQWIILSATPGDTWVEFIPVFVANGFYEHRTEFMERHVVWSKYSRYRIDRYLEVPHLEGLRARVLVEMPFNRHTTRHVTPVIVEYDKELFDKVLKKRWHVYEDRPIQHVAELFAVMRKVVNSDFSRLAEILRILEKHPRLIIFYNFDYELDILRTLKTTLSIPVAEYNGHKHESQPTGDSWVYIVQYTAGAEGWNCIETDAMVFHSLTYSYKIFEQSQGRIDRLNTPYFDLYYYVLRSLSKIDVAIVKSMANKKVFNEGRSTIAKGFLEAVEAEKASKNELKHDEEPCINPDVHMPHDWFTGLIWRHCRGEQA